MRKKVPKNKTPKRAPPRSSYHGTIVLLESIRDELKVLAEAVAVMGKRVDRLETEINSLNTKVDELIDKIGVRIDGHDEDIRLLKQA